ncbi:hypothetical protein [Rosenbergiella australiborealis]|nr:hypothetical protein [Rosenbergiella australiborealis]
MTINRAIYPSIFYKARFLHYHFMIEEEKAVGVEEFSGRKAYRD